MPDRRPLAAARRALDARQAEAVAAPPGPLLVLAGAGSGKTRVLTERAAALVAHHGQAAAAVLVITFTNRAAAELRARLAVLLGSDAERMTVGTFHAVCHRLLRAHAERAGRSPRFSIYDGQASRRLVAQALEELRAGEQLPARLVALQIGHAKARLLGPDDYRALLDSEPTRLVAAAYERYECALERSDALDFDDLIARSVVLLGQPDLAARYRRRWQAILVDAQLCEVGLLLECAVRGKVARHSLEAWLAQFPERDPAGRSRGAVLAAGREGRPSGRRFPAVAATYRRIARTVT